MIREKKIHRIEVHVAGICLREVRGEEFEILIGKRAPNRELFPNYWECGGGQVHRGRNFETAIMYHMKEEFNADVVVEYPIGIYEIKIGKVVIPGLRFICRLRDERQTINAYPEEFTEFKWISEDEIDSYDFVPGLKDDLKKAMNLYKKIIGKS